MVDSPVDQPVDTLISPARGERVQALSEVKWHFEDRAPHRRVVPIARMHLGAIVGREAPSQLIVLRIMRVRGEAREGIGWRR